MAQARNTREIGNRIESSLEALRAVADDETREKAEELVGLLVEFYGAGLERIVAIMAAEPDGEATLSRLAGDELVASLLVLHDLHPVDVGTRVQQALDKVRPYLGSHAGGVDFRGIDHDGVVHLRLEGSCHGCPSSTVTVKLAIERAILEAAPEVTRIEVEGVAEPPPKVISLDSLRRNGRADASGGSGRSGAQDGAWVAVAGLGVVEPGMLTTAEVAGASIVVCRVDSDLYAYRNACPGCGGAWTQGELDRAMLPCPICGERYDVRLAGRNSARHDLHLDPLPLLADADGVRVAIPAGAA